MRLNKKEQYALLFALYLSRAGKATCETIAESLNIPQSFLFQIASAMRKKGVVKAIRGPNGGYELRKDATVIQVLNSVGFEPVLTIPETRKYARGCSEERAFVTLTGNLSGALKRTLELTIDNVNGDLVRREVSQLNSATEARTV